MATIRLATLKDAGQTLGIYTPYITDTPISFESDVPSLEEWEQRMAGILGRRPWLVAELDSEILGYVYASTHRERAAYQWSVDVAVYVDSRWHRAGVGRALYTSLFKLLALQGYYNAFAGVTLPNEASVRLHQSMGFQPVGVYRSVGYKFGAWHDVGWWGRALREYAVAPSPPLDLAAAQERAGWTEAMESGTRLLRL